MTGPPRSLLTPARRGTGAILAATVALTIAGSGRAVSPAFVGHEWSRLPTNQRVVALTFDCGSNDAGVKRIMAALRARHAAATFFLAGKWAEAYRGQARAIAARYPVGNHTYSHPYLPQLSSDAAVRTEIARGASVIRRITSTTTKPLFRFPYGDRDQRTLAIAGRLGYGSVTWTVDTLGWKGRSAGGTHAIVSRVLSHLQPGEIVLMHVGAARDHSTLDADALPAILRAIAQRGYGFTTLVDHTSTYKQVADDAANRRFAASSQWGYSSSSSQRYGAGYHYATPAALADPARFSLRVPATANYLVYARWPAAPGNNRSAPLGITTTNGVRWVRVDQRRDGGRWVYLGSYHLPRGNRYLVQVSRRTSASGLLIADAARIVRRP
jgi:peptidoglycan/xylan/chitin deacetylase (PgdA/CDA1 family)